MLSELTIVIFNPTDVREDGYVSHQAIAQRLIWHDRQVAQKIPVTVPRVS